MAIRSREELMEVIRARIGDEPTDADVTFLEDIADTLDDYESRNADTTDWKKKYEENDASWKKKYTDRFYHSDPNDDKQDDDEEDKAPKTFADLFTVTK